MLQIIKEELQAITQTTDMTIRESVEYVKTHIGQFDHLLRDDQVSMMCRSHLKTLITSIEANYEMEVQHANYKDINLLDVIFYYRWFLQNLINKRDKL